MLLATSWGPKHGGINAFNMDFAIGLANHLSDAGKIFCAVFSPSLADIDDAKQKRVSLVGINRPETSDAYDPSWALDVWRAFEKTYPGERIDWWVGHDVTTGWAAVEGPTVAENGQSALLMHMNYADYQSYKGDVGERAQKKESQQRQLFPKANRHFANGPLLRNALKDIVNTEVVMLVPGFADVPVRPSTHRLQLITFGRMDRESDRIKQGALAVAGFATAVKQAHSNPGLPETLKDNPLMRVIGVNEPNGEEEQALRQLASEKAGRELNLMPLPFDENRHDLFDQLGRANIALMLSWHEGFGLTGWEAVAGEVPLIMSRQTGLWQLLKETLGERPAGGYVRTVDVRGQRGDNDTSNFLPEDESAVRDAIIDCVAHLSMARTDASKLKQELKNRLICTWKHTAEQFCVGLGIDPITQPVPGLPDLRPTHLADGQINRSTFVAIPEIKWPKELIDKGFEMPDSMLLRPESRVVRFHPFREALCDTIANWALEYDAPIKFRLQAGEGGAGKTRLLIEVCHRLELRHGWRAGFVDSSQSISINFPKFLQENRPSLIVLDYAESRTTEIIGLAKAALHSGIIPPVRVVLLAREGGDWWDRLADASDGDQAVSAILRGLVTKTGPYRMAQESIEQKDRGALFSQARNDFAMFKKMAVPFTTPPDLSADFFKNPLFVHLAALGSLRNQNSIDDKELLGMALGHERSYWRKLLTEANLPDQMLPALEQAVALLTLCGGKRTAKEAKMILARTPRLRELEPTVRITLFDILRRLYPNSIAGGLMGLQPDLLGEALVSEALVDDELLEVVFGEETDSTNLRQALTVLTRIGRRSPLDQKWLKLALERYLTKISEDALHVGMETGAPMPEILAEVISAAESHARRRAVEMLRIKLPNITLNLAPLKVEVRRQAVAFLESKGTGKGAKRHINLFEAFYSLSKALRDAGSLAESLDAARQAARHAELAFHTNSKNDQLRLASALGNLATCLNSVGRFDEELKVGERVEAIWRGLARSQPDIYSAPWANSLNNLGVCLGMVSRFDEALVKTQQSEGISRKLAALDPDSNTVSWANSISSLAIRLSDLGRFDEALQKTTQCERIFRGLAEKYPDAHLEDWARSLVNLSHDLGRNGDFEEACVKAEQAEAITRELAQKQPDVYSESWAKTLMTLSVGLRKVGHVSEILPKMEQVVTIRSSLYERQPDANAANWATTLGHLGICLLEIGRLDEALRTSEQSNAIWRDLAEKQPDAYSGELASSIDIIAGILGNVGRYDEAIRKGEQAEAMWRELAEKQADHCSAAWARSIDGLSVSLRRGNRFGESLQKAEQSEAIWRLLAKKQPNSYTADWVEALANLADAQLYAGKAELAVHAAEHAVSLISPFAQRYPSVYRRWLAFALRITADCNLSMERNNEALAAARRSTQLWKEVALTNKDLDYPQVARSFRAAIRSEIVAGSRDAVLSALGSAIEILREPLTNNPGPLRALMAELIDLASSVDSDAVIRIIPAKLADIIRSTS
jgi:tetratricopeptide (TPR) repeat protein